MNRDRVSDWLTTMPTYRQCVGRLIADREDGTRAHCAIGVAMARAALQPAASGIIIGTVPTTWGIRIAAFRPTAGELHPDTYPGVTELYDALEQWLGLDVLALRVCLRDLPEQLAADLRLFLPLLPHDDGWELWALNDYGVPLHLQRDALRVTLGVDTEHVGRPLLDLAGVPA
ncbi:hypothetical protein [Actinomycetospora termitidis]|uniref:Uncharacterized protein n=1 Tax=Actinomycetospora termitidis TaxID=3053470 RepID=A0ABT7MFM1_9PSEU|nr:hypothetical protein [Actinomycetospora sp. Odt1-22]MDL5159466.1 hypothetical protein [Actinomycetospora sp. Odt1-22]